MATSDVRELTEDEFQQLSQEERIEHARRVAERFSKPSAPDSATTRRLVTQGLAACGTTVVIMLLLWGAIVWTRKSQSGLPEQPKSKKQTGLFGGP